MQLSSTDRGWPKNDLIRRLATNCREAIGRLRQKARLGSGFGNSDWVNVSIVCAGEYVGLEEIDNGIWNVYFGPLKLGCLHERHMRIEDTYGRLKRHTV